MNKLEDEPSVSGCILQFAICIYEMTTLYEVLLPAFKLNGTHL